MKTSKVSYEAKLACMFEDVNQATYHMGNLILRWIYIVAVSVRRTWLKEKKQFGPVNHL